jgi:hypothetical protein
MIGIVQERELEHLKSYDRVYIPATWISKSFHLERYIHSCKNYV